MRLRDPSDVSAPEIVVCIDWLLRGSSKNRIPQMLGGDILCLVVVWANNSLAWPRQNLGVTNHVAEPQLWV